MAARRRGVPRARRITMLLENNAYPHDVRVRREAESLARAGYAVHVIAPRAPGQPARERVAGVDVERFRLPAEGEGARAILVEYLVANVQLHLRAARAIARGAGVLHLHNPPDTLFGAAALARLAGARVVFDLHDLGPELFAEKFGGPTVERVLRLFERLTARAASLVITTNESARDIVLRRDGVPRDRVAVVRNGPLADTIGVGTPPRAGVLRAPTLAFLGSMESQDGVDDLPAVLGELRERHGLAGARLVCIGDGSRRPALEDAFRAAGLGDAVTFTGYVRHERVPRLLAAADICLDPAPPCALNDRSTMIKIAEYLAAGRPVVAHPLVETRRTAGPAAEWTDRHDAVGLADAVASLAAAPERRAALAAAGLARVRELTWERSEQELLRVYARLAPSGVALPAAEPGLAAPPA